MKNITIELNPKSIRSAIKKLQNIRNKIPTMVDELLYESCVWIKNQANFYLENSGLNSGFITEIEQGWQPITKRMDGSFILTNRGRAYSVEFGIGIKGQGTYDGDVPPNYEYNVKTQYKNRDGSWIFRVEDIDTLDIKQENVMPRENTGEVVYEEGRTIRTQGQPAVMFCFNAIVDFKTQNIANKIWEKVKKKRIR
jgi:hypothetical protein